MGSATRWTFPWFLCLACLASGSRVLKESGSRVSKESVESRAKESVESQAQISPGMQFLEQLGRGINIGRTYEVRGSDFNEFSVRRKIDIFRQKGFRHVRIPVSWGQDFFLDARLRALTNVVQYALSRGLYVIINEHSAEFLSGNYDGARFFNDVWFRLWQSIANHFRSANDRLIFEILNGPSRVFGGQGGPDPSQQRQISLTRQINQVGYDAVRSVSRNRFVLVMPNNGGDYGNIRSVYPHPSNLPGGGNDQRVGVSVKSYNPTQFTGTNGQNGQNSFFANPQVAKDFIRRSHIEFMNYYYEVNVPVYIAEYGVGRQRFREQERNSDLVRTYYKYITNYFRLQGWPTAVYDDQNEFAITRGTQFVYGFDTAVLSSY